MHLQSMQALQSPLYALLPLPTRTFLNCHELFLNTVSISLRAKIEQHRDLHLSTARLVQLNLGPWCYCLYFFPFCAGPTLEVRPRGSFHLGRSF